LNTCALKPAEALDAYSILAEFCGIEKPAHPVGKSLISFIFVN